MSAFADKLYWGPWALRDPWALGGPYANVDP